MKKEVENEWEKVLEAVESLSPRKLKKFAGEPYGQRNLTIEELQQQILRRAPVVDEQTKRMIGDLLEKLNRRNRK